MDEFIKWASYGSLGIAGYIATRLVIPIITSSIHRNKAESSIYENAKDMIDFTNKQYAELQQQFTELKEQLHKVELELRSERAERKKLQAQLDQIKGENHG